MSNPGLDKRLFSKIKQEYFDYDYIDKLSEKDKAWLSKFNEEYLGAKLNGEGKPLHRTKKLRKDCFSRNNSRNRDMLGIARVTGRLEYTDAPYGLNEPASDYEDALIDYIDSKNLKNSDDSE